MVARFERPKDHQLLLHAVTKINGDWKLVLIGDGPMQPQARASAARLGLSSRVEFAGARDDVAEQLDQSAIFVLLSHWEGLPLTIIEAMRSRLPVVASNVGGIPELVEDGKTGYLVQNNPGAVAAALQRLIDQPALSQAMGIAGRSLFERRFSIDRMVRETTRVYLDALPYGPASWRESATDSYTARTASRQRVPNGQSQDANRL
jgi:glycosyltransferase involved in cell wall biosynthesis